MRIKFFLLMLATISVVATSCQNGGSIKKGDLKTSIDSTSYALGILIAQQNKQSLQSIPGGKDINIELLAAAFRQVLKAIQPFLLRLKPMNWYPVIFRKNPEK